LFGVRVARVEGDTLTPERWSAIRAWCQAEGVACLYFLASATDASTVTHAEASGFHLVDVRLELGRPVGAPLPAPPSCPVRPATADDVNHLMDMASDAYTGTRFARDPHFPAESARRLYRTWIAESCRGWAQAVLVAEQTEAAGFITLHRDPDAWRIGLVGVAEAHRGHGVGTALVSAAIRHAALEGGTRITVVTQAANLPAVRLYERHGFRASQVGLWYHRWFEPGAHD
jgi:dTDP-4-amino-4,6-dideoxy-D-galactose acyltransferase